MHLQYLASSIMFHWTLAKFSSLFCYVHILLVYHCALHCGVTCNHATLECGRRVGIRLGEAEWLLLMYRYLHVLVYSGLLVIHS